MIKSRIDRYLEMASSSNQAGEFERMMAIVEQMMSSRDNDASVDKALERVVGVFTQVRVKTRRDRGDLEPKSKRGRRKTENLLHREPKVRLRTTVDHTGTRPLRHRGHGKTTTQEDTNNEYILMNASE